MAKVVYEYEEHGPGFATPKEWDDLGHSLQEMYQQLRSAKLKVGTVAELREIYSRLDRGYGNERDIHGLIVGSLALGAISKTTATKWAKKIA